MNKPEEYSKIPSIIPSPAPRGFMPTLAALGPGIVVAGSVIGAGELINAPIRASEFGFVLLWAAILACLIKYFLQVEIGRHAIVHNRTTFEALGLCPGPKVFNTSWVGWVYMIGYTVTQVGLVGILLAISGLLHAVCPIVSDPTLSVTLWGFIVVGVTQFLLWRSLYDGLEKIVTVMVAVFSLAAVLSLVLIQGTDYRISTDEILSGLRFSFGDNPGLATIAVISLIGALGTTANELFQYPYWLIEKGYAAKIGARDSEGWLERSRGWIRVLRIDVGVATLLATIITAAFFLLGAAVFFRSGTVPEGIGVVHQISRIFTETYGEGSRVFFVVGGIATLFSSFFVSSAASGRMGADLLGTMRVIERGNSRAVRRSQQVFQSLYLAIVLVFFLILKGQKPPAQIVIFAQFVSGAFNTPLLMFGICWMAFRTESKVRMGRVTAICLVGSVLVIVTCLLAALAVRLR